MNNDLIKRSDVEQMLTALGGCDASDKEAAGWDNAIDAAMEGLRKVESADKWILCSERLPDEEARRYILNNLDGIGYLYPCLLTYRSPNTEKVHAVRFYYDIDMQCFVNHGEKMCEKARCIAWKPLPEPYKEDLDDR